MPREPGEDDEEATATAQQMDVRRIYPSLRFDSRRGCAFEVAADSKLTSFLPAGDVMRIFQQHFPKGGYPRTVSVKAKDGTVRTMTDLGPWWQCDECKKHVVEFEDRVRSIEWTEAMKSGHMHPLAPTGRTLCSECHLKVKIDTARRDVAAYKAKREKKRAEITLLPGLNGD